MADLKSFKILPYDDTGWMDFISTNPDAQIFHYPAWVSVLAKCYHFHPFIAAITNSQGQITAGLPVMEMLSILNKRRWISLPFTDHCAPLHSDPESFKLLEKEIIEEACRQNIDLELRWNYPSSGLFLSDNHVLSTLRLSPDSKTVVKNLKGHNTFTRTKTAAKHGVRVEIGTSLDQLKAFYDLHVRTRRRLGVPVQPWRFFQILREDILETGLGFISLARQEGSYIAGMIMLHWNQTLIYKYSASDELGRKLSASYLLCWEAICWGCKNGFTKFDWGRTETSDEGLRMYKRQWGSDEVPLIYSSNRKPDANGFGERIKPIMMKVINMSPLWVCRLSGEFLYKYFA